MRRSEVHVLDPRERRQPGWNLSRERRKGLLFTLDVNHDLSGLVAHPTGQAVRGSQAMHEWTEAHALHHAGDRELRCGTHVQASRSTAP